MKQVNKIKDILNNPKSIIIFLTIMLAISIFVIYRVSNSSKIYISSIKDENISISTIHAFINNDMHMFYSTPANYNKDDYKIYGIEVGYYIKNNNKAVEAVLNKKIDSLDNLKYRYKAVLEIPSIKLKRGILDIDNKYNKAKYNIELIKEKDDIIVLASHNGNNYNSYFGNLKNISLGDTINYYYDGKIYKYIYTDSYDIKKDGYADIYRKKGNKCIVLVTCKDGRNDGQTVFIGYLDEILEY